MFWIRVQKLIGLIKLIDYYKQATLFQNKSISTCFVNGEKDFKLTIVLRFVSYLSIREISIIIILIILDDLVVTANQFNPLSRENSIG